MESNDISSPSANTLESTQAQSETPQQLVEPTPPKKTKKWLLPLLIVVLALSLCTTGFFTYQNYRLEQQASRARSPSTLITTPTHTPTALPIIEEETANFKVFKHYSPYHRYSIQYPSNLDVVLVGATSGNARFSFKTKEEIETNLVIINFFPDKIPPVNDLDKIQESGEEGGYYKLIPDPERIIQKEETKMAGFSGLKVFTINGEQKEQVYEYILLPVENKVLVFTLRYKFPEPASLDDIPDNVTKVTTQIIDTYKQLEELSLNWKLYSDKRFPIGINYPPNWDVEQKSEKEDYIISFKPPATENLGESSIELHFLPKAKEAMVYEPTRFEQFIQREENAPQETLNLERYAFTFSQGGDYAIKVNPTSRKANLSVYFPCQNAKCANYLIRADLFVGNEEVFEELSEIFDQMLVSFNKIFLKK